MSEVHILAGELCQLKIIQPQPLECLLYRIFCASQFKLMENKPANTRGAWAHLRRNSQKGEGRESPRRCASDAFGACPAARILSFAIASVLLSTLLPPSAVCSPNRRFQRSIITTPKTAKTNAHHSTIDPKQSNNGGQIESIHIHLG